MIRQDERRGRGKESLLCVRVCLLPRSLLVFLRTSLPDRRRTAPQPQPLHTNNVSLGVHAPQSGLLASLRLGMHDSAIAGSRALHQRWIGILYEWQGKQQNPKLNEVR